MNGTPVLWAKVKGNGRGSHGRHHAWKDGQSSCPTIKGLSMSPRSSPVEPRKACLTCKHRFSLDMEVLLG